jgi:hypothetical protein
LHSAFCILHFAGCVFQQPVRAAIAPDRALAAPFDGTPPAGHNSIVLRVALGAIVLAAGLFAAAAQAPSAVLSADDASRPASAQAPQRCTDTDGDGGEWNPQRHAAASTSESAWRWRSLQAAFVTQASAGTNVSPAAAASSLPRAPAAPAHLLHTPLLI